MSTEGMTRIILQALWPSSAHPVRLYGSFDADGALERVEAPDMALGWRRKQGEAPASFENRIIDDILVARHIPPLPRPAGAAEQLRTQAPLAPPIRSGQHEPKHFGQGHGKQRKIAADA